MNVSRLWGAEGTVNASGGFAVGSAGGVGIDECALILLNSSFATQVINENCHYYKHPPQTPSPKTFDISDFHDIIASDRLYARKFDMLKSPELFDKIDEFLSNQ